MLIMLVTLVKNTNTGLNFTGFLPKKTGISAFSGVTNSFYLRYQRVNNLIKIWIGVHQPPDLVPREHYRGMVPVEGFTYFRQGHFCQVAGQEHRYLAWKSYGLVSARGLEIFPVDAVFIGDGGLYDFNAYAGVFLVAGGNMVFYYFFYYIYGGLGSHVGTIIPHGYEAAFQLPDVFFNALCDEGYYVVGNYEFVNFFFLAQDGYAGLQIRHLYVNGEAGQEPGDQPLAEGEFLGGPVGGYNYLLFRFKQRIKSVEKFLFTFILADKELYVVQEDAIQLPVFVPERFRRFVLKVLYIFIDEILAGGIDNARRGIGFEHFVGYAVQEVGFPQAGRAVYKKGIGFARALGKRHGGGVSETV